MNEVERYKMEVEGHKVLSKNTHRKEIDLTPKVNAPSLNGAGSTKAVLQHKLKEASDNAMFGIVEGTAPRPYFLCMRIPREPTMGLTMLVYIVIRFSGVVVAMCWAEERMLGVGCLP